MHAEPPVIGWPGGCGFGLKKAVVARRFATVRMITTRYRLRGAHSCTGARW